VPEARVAPRIDPKRRPSHERGKFGVQNGDPNKFYVWANIDDVDTGRAHYEYLGYDVETYKDKGVLPAVGRTDQRKLGAEITSSGHVLMSCSKEHREELKAHGREGDTGQADADRIERAMVINRGDKNSTFRASIMGGSSPGVGLRYASGENDRI
jgi:hypothetical protein